ncbi:hypothetical protein KR044_000382, partial [Drosophila immigrans]
VKLHLNITLIWHYLQDAVTLRFTNLICHSTHPSKYSIQICRLKALQRNKIALNFNGTAHYTVNKVTLDFQILKKANGYKPWLYNYHVDCCEYLKRHNHPVLNIVTNILKEYTNSIHPCPFEGTQYINGLYLKPNSIPLPLPTGEYGLIMKIKLDDIVDVVFKIYFEFIEDLWKG